MKSHPGRRPRCSVLGTEIDVLEWDPALATCLRWALRHESRYVCHANVHAVVTANTDEVFRHALNGADLVAADGMPLVWIMRQQGFGRHPRLSGPDFMWRFCARAEALRLAIYLYGGSIETLTRLHERLVSEFPNIRIAGMCSPPYRTLSEEENQEATERINASGAHAVFVALGCPKQEAWMARQRGAVQAVMFGVGAAFDYHAGTVRRAPPWMQARGLEWLHRLWRNPRRLWRRYLVTNSLFLVFVLWHLLRDPFARREGVQ
jgi:N-acetylglucosaminyldiphosphoundecaprenol N-acetyl-beta-D-mannosaminyltransferase